jgi:AcrR family transcriptional regulator
MTAPSDDADSPLADQAVRRRLGRLQADAEQDVQRLVDIGRQLMAESGSYPRVADIVRAAGMSNDAFYRYFKSKDDLVAAIVDDGSRRLLSYVEHRMSRSAEPAGRLRAAVDAVMQQAGDPDVATATRNVFRNSSHAARSDRAGKARLERGLAEVLTGPIAAMGAPDPGRDARAVAVLLVNLMDHFLWLEESPSRAEIEHACGFVVGGVGAPASMGRRGGGVAAGGSRGRRETTDPDDRR